MRYPETAPLPPHPAHSGHTGASWEFFVSQTVFTKEVGQGRGGAASRKSGDYGDRGDHGDGGSEHGEVVT